MNYTTADAIALWQKVQSDMLTYGPQVGFENAREHDPELLAMTLTLAISSAYPLPHN